MTFSSEQETSFFEEIGIEPPEKPRISNVMTSFLLGQDFDLPEISFRLRNAEYNPRRYRGVIIRVRNPGSTAILYENGRVLMYGAKSIGAAKRAAVFVCRLIQRLGYDVTIEQFKVTNIVAYTNTRFQLALEALSNSHYIFAEYEPEVHPALSYFMKKPKVTFIIYATGYISITGAKNFEDILEGFKRIYPVLLAFRVKQAISNNEVDAAATLVSYKRAKKETNRKALELEGEEDIIEREELEEEGGD